MNKPDQSPLNKPPELHPIKLGGRTIALPAPDNGCQRCDHLGKPPLVPFSFRQRLLAFFMAGDATPTQARYFYVQCARFIAGINETRETYAKLQAAIVRRDQGKASIFDVTEDSLCMWNFYPPINMIFTSCMMSVAGRVLYLYGMCHRELTSTEREQMVMKSWRDRTIKANPDDRLSGHDVVGESCISECEEIATSINGLVKAGYIAKAQELLDLSQGDYFVLQLAMFADKNVNAYITIAAWKQAGLRLPAEDTAEFFPYGDSPSNAEEQSTAEAPTSKSRGDEPVKAGKPINWREVKFGNDEAQYGASLIRSGIRDYRSWSERLVLKYGESVRENLSTIYSEAETRAAAVDAMEQESCASLGPSVWKPLENAAWSSDAVREHEMLPLRVTYNDLSTWHPERLKFVVEGIAVLSVSVILAEMKPLPEEIRNQCRNVTTQPQAVKAADEVESVLLSLGRNDPATSREIFRATRAANQMSWAAVEASWGAIRAAWTLPELASAAAKAADAARAWGANPDDVLRKACKIWIHAADWAGGHAEKQTQDTIT